jgi:hypothetical protein
MTDSQPAYSTIACDVPAGPRHRTAAVCVPAGPPPVSGWPLVLAFHGGQSHRLIPQKWSCRSCIARGIIACPLKAAMTVQREPCGSDRREERNRFWAGAAPAAPACRHMTV